MSKHPWRLHIEKPKEVLTGLWRVETLTDADHYGSNYVAVLDSEGRVVADNADYYAQPITLEDARLIAAAPELLAALISTEEILEDEHWSTTKRVLRELIAKATGGQP